MGLGIGIDCERCGEQICIPGGDEDRNLCEGCVKELRKAEYDSRIRWA